MYSNKGNPVGGTTLTLPDKHSKIFVSPSAKGMYFSEVHATKMVLVHEMMHSYHISKGLPNYSIYTERATSTYSQAYLKAYGALKGAKFYSNAVK